eukprot:TRINITY_DN48742_c0_g1_i1.p1 TRINITY_DN48742_c0_g1~~TRINITY_DN48742_c0_g1_i1.p1  ORF type:complete len:551 (+),score=63.89 TRINITY_DN48742_c0_g1_i1:82-1734(+)
MGERHIPRNRSAVQAPKVRAGVSSCFIESQKPRMTAEQQLLRTFEDGLARATRSGYPDEIEFVCDRAEAAGMCATATAEARALAGKMRAQLAEEMLDRAAKGSNYVEIEEACSVAMIGGVSPNKIKRLQERARSLRAENEIAVCIKIGNVRKIDSIAEYAADLGIDAQVIENARKGAKLAHAKSRLRNAMLRKDPTELLAAVGEGIVAGIHKKKIDEAKKLLLGFRCADESDVLSVLGGVDARQISEAVDGYEKFQTTTSIPLVSAARRKVALLSTCTISLCEKLEACFLVGRSEQHNLAARLLAQILAPTCPVTVTDSLARDLTTMCIFDPTESKVLTLDGSASGVRGGRPYSKPVGWLRWAMQWREFEKHRDWCVAYHGTHPTRLLPILFHGLRRPGDEGVTSLHGQAGSQTGKSIYLSPSIEYAAFPVYGQFFKVAEQHWAQVVLECLVRPDAFQEKPGSLGNKYWPRDLAFDPAFSNLEGLEWLVEDSQAVVVHAMLIREFGVGAAEGPYLPLAAQVTEGNRGPEYDWTARRIDSFRSHALRAEYP